MGEQPIKCISCGRFIPYSDMDPERGPASFYFEPDNEFGRERSEWTCAACVEPFPGHSHFGG